MRKLTDLSRNEIIEIAKNTPRLLQKCRDYCGADYSDYNCPAYYTVDDYLHGIPKGAEYSISGYCDSLSFERCNYKELADYFFGLQKDFCLLGGDDTDIYSRIYKLQQYGEIIHDSDYGYINVKDKDYKFLERTYNELLEEFTKTILDICTSEYEYFMDDENIIDYSYEMEELEDIYITDDNKAIDMEAVTEVLNANNIHWDASTIISLIEQIDNKMNGEC